MESNEPYCPQHTPVIQNDDELAEDVPHFAAKIHHSIWRKSTSTNKEKTTTWLCFRYKGASGSSAVCAFSMAQVERAFSGRYREVNRETQQWYTYNHPVPEPRPGAVSGAEDTQSSQTRNIHFCRFIHHSVHPFIQLPSSFSAFFDWDLLLHITNNNSKMLLFS